MLLMQESGWTTMQAYTKQNMGMGFAYIAPTLEAAEELVQVIEMRGENKAKIVGEVTASKEPGLVTILHKTFESALKEPLAFRGYTK
jgi:phosphoribosylaminoimidazole (AIR) synthetase